MIMRLRWNWCKGLYPCRRFGSGTHSALNQNKLDKFEVLNIGGGKVRLFLN